MPARAALVYLNHALHHRPFATNLALGSFFGFTGDVICQFGVQKRSTSEFDHPRLWGLTTFFGFYASTFSLRIFAMYPKILPHFIMKSPFREGMVSSMLDNCVHSPFLYLPLFYVWTGWFEGESAKHSLYKYADQFVPAMKALLVIWMPIQFLNFSIVPRNHRVAFVGLGNLVWNVIIDYISHETVPA